MLMSGNKISTWLVLLVSFYFYLTTAADSTTVSNIEFSETKGDPLVADESKKHKTVIKEVNYGDDIIPGTYTLGYEADDGTFKYESRDVLVNAKDTSSSVEISDESSTAFSNSSSELRPTTRPVVTSSVYSTSRSNVIQSIPRRKTSKDDIEESSSQQPKLIFATSVPSTTSRIIMPSSPHTRPILKNGIFVRSTIPPQTHSARIEGQLIRPSQDSTTTKPQDGNYVRRVLVSRQPIVDIKSSTETQVTSSTERPTTLDNFLNEKDSVKQQRSNTFRRQLPPGDRGINNYESQQIINYHQSTGDDTTDIYGNSMITGTQRPLFTTTQNSRVLPTPTPRHLTNGRNGQYLPLNPYRQKDHLVEAPTTSTSTTEEPYPTQTSVPVISIPEYSERQYQKIPPRYQEYARELGPQMEVADQHITDTPIPEDYRRQGPLQFPQATPQPLLYRQQRRNRPPQNIGYDYPDRYQQGYQQELVSNAIPEEIQPPVTNRDFQRLLHQLIFVQAKLQQLAQIAYQQNPQNFDPALYQRIQQPIQPFPPQPNPGYAVRPSPYGPVQFEQPAPPQQYVPRGHRAYLPRPNYPQESPQYDSSEYDPRYQHHFQRRKAQYQPPQQSDQYQQQPEYLPPEIREMLLLRMLQLAINSELAATNQMDNIATAPSKTSVSTVNRHKNHQNPVRNVKILGEEKDQFKPTARSKRYQQDPNEDMDYYE